MEKIARSVRSMTLAGCVLLLTVKAVGQIASFPYAESFESGFGDWANVTGDDFDWAENSGGTPSGNTGPSGAHDGSQYVYIEASNPNYPSREAYLEATFDFSSNSQPLLTFYTHMYGRRTGTLSVDVNDGSWTNDVFTISGEQQTSSAQAWDQQSVDLSAYGGQSGIIVRFRVLTNSTNQGWRGDIGLDLIECTNQCTVAPGSSAVSASSICTPETIDLTLTGQDGGASLQWQQSADGINYSDLVGLTSAAESTSLTTPGTYYYRAAVTNGCTDYSSVSTVTYNTSDGAQTLPYYESFETGLGNFVNASNATLDWERQAFGTPSNFTGPSAASDFDYFLYTEATDPNFNVDAVLELNMDLTGTTNPQISFDYHMYGEDMGTLELWANGTQLFTVSGEQQTASDDAWLSQNIDLSAYAGECLVNLQFIGTTGDNWRSDMAIDNVQIDEPCAISSGTASATRSICSPEEMEITISGQEAGASLQWEWSTDGTNFTQVAGETDDTLNISGLNHDQTYFFRCAVSDGCATYSNEVSGKNPGINSFPYGTSFETDFDVWVNNTSDDDNNWARHTGATASISTGPSATDFGNYYLFVEASDPFLNTTAYLEADLDFSEMNNPLISFGYYMYGADLGTLQMEVYDGSTWTTAFTSTGQIQASDVDAWSQSSVDLSAYAGMCPVKIRFSAATGTTYLSDIALDFIEIIDDCNSIQGGNAVATNAGLCGSGSIDLNLINYSEGNTIQWQQSSDNISFVDVLNATTASESLGPFATGSTYHFRAIVTSPSCIVVSDTVSITVQDASSIVSSFPYTESFESGLGDWAQSSSDGMDWVWNTGGTASSNTGPSVASDGSYYFYTEASGDGSPSIETVLEQSFDFSSLGSPFIAFDYHMYGADMGSLFVEVFDGGWTTLHTISGQQQTASGDSWARDTVDLSAYGGQCGIALRFRGVTGTNFRSDMALDNIYIGVNQGWTGLASSDWHTNANWAAGSVLSSGSSLVLTDVVSTGGNDAVIQSGDVVVGDLRISAGATLSLNNDFHLTVTGDLVIEGSLDVLPGSNSTISVQGDVYVYGQLDMDRGKLEFSGSGTQRLYGSGAQELHHVEVANGATFEPQVDLFISGVISLGENTTFDVNGREITLTSDQTYTGSLAAVPATANFNGDLTIQRFYPNTKKQYRYISSPIVDAQVLDWQDDFWITGQFTGANTGNGLGTTSSLYWYDESVPSAELLDGYVGYPTSDVSENIVIGRGYAAYMRNDSTGNILLDVSGTPQIAHTADFDFNVIYSNNGLAEDGWNLVGNPLPSPIDWDAASGWTKTNVENAIYFNDNENGNDVSYVNGISNPPGACNGIIPMGQAFWVRANATSAQLTINENAKADADPGQVFYKEDPGALIYITLKNHHRHTEDITVLAQDPEATMAFDPSKDAKKFDLSAGISSVANTGEDLSINSFEVMNDPEQAVELRLFPESEANHSLSFQCLAWDGAYLIDSYLDEVHAVYDGMEYDFFISSDPGSSENRFKVVFVEPSIITDVNEDVRSGALHVFPNPTLGHNLSVTIEEASGEFFLYGLDGHLVYEGILGHGHNNVDFPFDLPTGMYLYRIVTPSQLSEGHLSVID